MNMSNRLVELQATEVAHVLNAELPEAMQNEIKREFLDVHERQSALGRHTRRVLLIGGAGYVGSVITEHLLATGYAVRCLDLLLYHNDICVLPYAAHNQYEFIYGDHGDTSVMATALNDVTDVVILSGLVGDPITKKYPGESTAINNVGINTVLDALNGRSLNRLIFVSTCSNYGSIAESDLADETYELKPLSLYAEAKVVVEQRLLSTHHDADYVPTVLRFATAFGLSPRMRFDLTVNEFTREMFLENDLLVYDAQTWRPYCHTRDFARAIRRVLEMPQNRVAREVFNVGKAENNCTKQMIIEKIHAHIPTAPVSYKEHGDDPRNYKVDFRKITDQLLFQPKYSVDDGIEEIIAALRNHLFDHVDEHSSFYGNYEVSYPH